MVFWANGAGSPTHRLAACPERRRRGLGSTLALANGSGSVTATWTYDVFGAVRSHNGSSATEFTFTGEQNPSAAQGRLTASSTCARVLPLATFR